MDQEHFDEYLGKICYAQSTEAIWYRPETAGDEHGWEGEESFNNRLRSYSSIGRPRLDIVILKGHPRLTGVSATKEHFQQLLELFQIPKAHLDAIFSNNGQLAHFSEYSSDDSEEGCSRICAVMQTPHSVIRSFSLALTISLQTGTAAGIIIVEAKKDSERILRLLRSQQQLVKECPLHILTVLCQELSRRNEGYREDLDNTLLRAERQIGATAYYSNVAAESKKALSPKVPYESLVRDLHALNTSLIWLSCTTNFELAALRFTTSMIELYEKEVTALSLPSFGKPARENLLQPIRYLENAGEMRQYQRNGLQQRVETQIQILYSRISQRDSLLNLEIANESRRIAIFTREDSIAINTISIVTLFFLPAMLVATVCSSGVFDFQEDTVVVSRKWWILLVFTAGSTVLVLGIWGFYLWWKRRTDPISSAQPDESRFSDVHGNAPKGR
ncbi:Notoamide biosynthesis cluster protein M' [Paramyrothecium foliicola]|nr:Notoamide biosynthesis cluster protein M' [Paramyrothecium foliicola]